MDPKAPSKSVLRIGNHAVRCKVTGLKMYSTKRKARVIAERVRSGGTMLYYFRCRHCERWHLTKIRQKP